MPITSVILQAQHWLERDPTDQAFREKLLCLLQDWGCWLDLELYMEALVHFAGGQGKVAQWLPLTRGKVRKMESEKCFND